MHVVYSVQIDAFRHAARHHANATIVSLAGCAMPSSFGESAMTVEIGHHESRPHTRTCSIPLGAIPAQATRMAADAKSELVRALSQQVSKVLCGRYTTPADVISSSVDLMGLGLVWCESIRVAHGELVVALIDGIMHFKFHGDLKP